MNAAPEVVVLRGERIESRHRVAVAVCDGAGTVRQAAGDPEEPVFLRSAAKPFQAAAALAAGALDRFAVSDAELAVICASHNGEDAHVEIVRGLLARLGLDEGALRCGVHPPLDRASAERVGSGAGPLHNNCSGKHAGMLALTLHLGAPPETYLDPEGAAQRAILTGLAQACGLPESAVGREIDGCGAPVFVVPLRTAARAYACLANPERAPDGLRDALERISVAMAGYPYLVAGSGRFDTLFMSSTAGRFVAKSGAEAVLGIADRTAGLGLFLKISDGNARAAAPAALEALRQTGSLEDPLPVALRPHHRPAVVNHAGRLVGRIEPRFVLEKPAEGKRHGR